MAFIITESELQHFTRTWYDDSLHGEETDGISDISDDMAQLRLKMQIKYAAIKPLNTAHIQPTMDKTQVTLFKATAQVYHLYKY